MRRARARARAPRRSPDARAAAPRARPRAGAASSANGRAACSSRRTNAARLGDVLLAALGRPRAWARRRARSSSTRMPAKPPASRGPRRQASSSSRTRCRNAATGSPPPASGCLSVASSVTGLTPSVIRRAESRRKPPGGRLVERRAGGIVDLDAPAPQLDRDPAGEMAIGRDQGGGAARGLERGAHPQRQRQRLARQVRMVLDGEVTDRLRRRRRQRLPGADRGARPQHLGQEARARGRGAERRPAPARSRPRRARSPAPRAAASGRTADGSPPAAASSPRRGRGRARAARPCRAAGGRRPGAARGSPGMLPVEPAATIRPAGGSARQRSASAVSRRWRRSAGSSAPISASTCGQASAMIASTSRLFCQCSASVVRDQAVEGGERHALGLQLVEQRRELGRRGAARARSASRAAPAGAPAAAAAATAPTAGGSASSSVPSSSSSSASISPIGWIRGNSRGRPPARRRKASPRLRHARRVGSRTRTSASAARSPSTSASRPAASASTNGSPIGMVATLIKGQSTTSGRRSRAPAPASRPIRYPALVGPTAWRPCPIRASVDPRAILHTVSCSRSRCRRHLQAAEDAIRLPVLRSRQTLRRLNWLLSTRRRRRLTSP